MRLVRLAAVLALGAALAARADDPPKGPPPKGSGPPVEIRMGDGSTVRMALTQPAIEVTTKYGKLSVPATEVRRVEFGFRYPEGAEEKITQLVAQLADGNYKRRETAAVELLAFRELAYPALKRAAKSSDAEQARRAGELVAKLEERLSPEKLKFREYDQVTTTDFTARGRIEARTLLGYTPYFGEVKLQVTEVRSLRSVAAGGEVTVQVDSTKYLDAAHTAWFDTEVDLTADTPVEVVAGGQVRLISRGRVRVRSEGAPELLERDLPVRGTARPGGHVRGGLPGGGEVRGHPEGGGLAVSADGPLPVARPGDRHLHGDHHPESGPVAARGLAPSGYRTSPRWRR